MPEININDRIHELFKNINEDLTMKIGDEIYKAIQREDKCSILKILDCHHLLKEYIVLIFDDYIWNHKKDIFSCLIVECHTILYDIRDEGIKNQFLKLFKTRNHKII